MSNILARLNRALLPVKRPLYRVERRWYSRRPRMLKLPDFMSIGSGQAGSTWLYRNFQHHPGIFMADGKETHYFSRLFECVSLHFYSSLFAEAGTRICGEMTPNYTLLVPERIGFIHRLMPDLRLILTVRNPVERAWSGARRSISGVAKQQGVEFSAIPDDEFYEYFQKEWAYRPERQQGGAFNTGMLQAHYCRAMDNWTAVFPAEQLLVCFFDEIAREPRQLMERICRHLGASTDVDWSQFPLWKKVNANPAHAIPERFAAYLSELYAGEIAELRSRFPHETAGWQA